MSLTGNVSELTNVKGLEGRAKEKRLLKKWFLRLVGVSQKYESPE